MFINKLLLFLLICCPITIIVMLFVYSKSELELEDGMFYTFAIFIPQFLFIVTFIVLIKYYYVYNFYDLVVGDRNIEEYFNTYVWSVICTCIMSPICYELGCKMMNKNGCFIFTPLRILLMIELLVPSSIFIIWFVLLTLYNVFSQVSCECFKYLIRDRNKENVSHQQVTDHVVDVAN